MIVCSREVYVNQLKRMWKSVFKDSDAYIKLFFDRKYRHKETLIHVEKGKVKSMIFFPRYDVKIKDVFYKAGYICGAATLPECRGCGLMSELLSKAFNAMETRGDSFSVLIPQEENLYGFYSRYGYKEIFKKGTAEYTANKLKKIEPPRIVIEKLAGIGQIMPLYKKIIAKHPVAVMQNRKTYGIVFDVCKTYGDFYLIRDKKGAAAGYMFCEQHGKEKILKVKEILAASDVLIDAAKILHGIYRPGKIIFEGIYGGALPFTGIKTAGMLKILKGDLDISSLVKSWPYMNMMLD